MSTTEDESQRLDAGWDTATEADVDEAWDSVPAPVSRDRVSSRTSSSPPSAPVATEEVDSGWDDVPAGTPRRDGKARPHRPRRVNSGIVPTASNPVVLPRPAAPSKKHQREHARQQRLYEAKVKQERKAERKTQRAAQALEAAERVRRAEAEERARREARERERRERSAEKSSTEQRKRSSPKTPPKVESVARRAVPEDVVSVRGAAPADRRLRVGLVVALVALFVAAAFFVLRR